MVQAGRRCSWLSTTTQGWHSPQCIRTRSSAGSAVLAQRGGLLRSPGHYRDRLLTDNGSAFRSRAFRATCIDLGIKHSFTRPHRPQTNGKAERFIQSALREWGYGWTYQNSAHRTDALASWQHHCNWDRPHRGIGGIAPMARLNSSRNNLLTRHIQRAPAQARRAVSTAVRWLHLFVRAWSPPVINAQSLKQARAEGSPVAALLSVAALNGLLYSHQASGPKHRPLRSGARPRARLTTAPSTQ
ncbi:hypothetical protein J2W28_004912 [Variovorax boronicumulans]|uniref:integrase core domain-containing protein n=1 Tax=Variovorax boronicumulans TaxID=436515 RepID=UPI0027899689|nr:hypothetical protein [Variovorax boronicumulans]MDQ0005743.1 hypothetical protein [Variovorax boronicumulans]MDQ0044378.1 hypothetical protein [Variovorax boronicumulans]